MDYRQYGTTPRFSGANVGYTAPMRRNSHDRYSLNTLSTLALAALLVVCCAGTVLGGGILSLVGAVISTSLLTLSLARHELDGSTHEAQVLGKASGAYDSQSQSQTALPAEPSLSLPDSICEQSEPPASDADDTLSDTQELASVTETSQDSPARLNGSQLDFPALAERVTTAASPIDELKRFVGDIRTREAQALDNPLGAPCELERYAARMLEEAGLFASDVALPKLSAVQLRSSHLMYLRHADSSLPYLAKQRIIRLEAALNAIRFAWVSLAPDATQEEAYRLNQGLARSIVAQAHPIDEPMEPIDGKDWPEGEWSVRYGISQAIETMQLPYRLVARYRTNVADGNVAIEVDLTPADVFPSSCFVDGLGIVPTTGDMRQQASADYALRLAILLAASAFRCSSRIRHVWVAGIVDTPSRRTCYYCVDFDRWRFSRIDLADLGDLSETYRSFAPLMRYEDGWLRPVRQSFHLEEERFCPTRRYLPVSLSSRRLEGHVARSLGTDHVSGLAIEESDGRALVASAIMMRLAPGDDARATQKNVRTVMELAGDDPDPTVRTAAERVVRGMVDGSLGTDALSVGEEFVRGDELTRANDTAKILLMQQKPTEARRALMPLLERIDEAGTYADTPGIAYRYFSSYVERALYNRLRTDEGKTSTVMLVPDAFYEAHLLVSITYLMEGQAEAALAHAERLIRLAPLDARARLHAVKCLEMLERDGEAIDQLIHLLNNAYEPQGAGFGYYRMAYFQWKQGNVEAAQACYRSAMRLLPSITAMMTMEISVLYLQNPEMAQDEMQDGDIEDILRANSIPVAPPEHTSELFYDCARASLDAEIFPVARNFAYIMGSIMGDDVNAGVIRSLEDEPDR